MNSNQVTSARGQPLPSALAASFDRFASVSGKSSRNLCVWSLRPRQRSSDIERCSVSRRFPARLTFGFGIGSLPHPLLDLFSQCHGFCFARLIRDTDNVPACACGRDEMDAHVRTELAGFVLNLPLESAAHIRRRRGQAPLQPRSSVRSSRDTRRLSIIRYTLLQMAVQQSPLERLAVTSSSVRFP